MLYFLVGLVLLGLVSRALGFDSGSPSKVSFDHVHNDESLFEGLFTFDVRRDDDDCIIPLCDDDYDY